MQKIVLICLTIATLLPCFGQNSQEKDTTSIISFVDKIIIKANIDTKTESFFLISDNQPSIELLTNNEYRLNLSLDYEFLGFSFGYAPKFLPDNNDDALKGESSFTDFRFRFFIRKWTQELRYGEVQGFYVVNTEDFVPDWIEGEDPFIQFPNIKITSWGGSTSYVFNDRFSLRNVAYNTEWQVRSAGSFIPTLQYNYQRTQVDIEDQGRSFENFLDVRISPDYYYTFVIHENWFLSPSLSPGISIRISKEGDFGTQNTENNIRWPVGLRGGLQLGYSSRRIIFGANFDFDNTWYNEDANNVVINDKASARVYFGYRFDAPKLVKNTFGWVNRQLGL